LVSHALEEERGKKRKEEVSSHLPCLRGAARSRRLKRLGLSRREKKRGGGGKGG